MTREIFAVIIAEVIVTCYSHRLDAAADEKIDEYAFHSSLSGFEIVPSNPGFLPLRQFPDAGDERVLRRAVDERNLSSAKVRL